MRTLCRFLWGGDNLSIEVVVMGEKGWMRMREWGTGVPFETGLSLELGGEKLMEGVQIPSYYTLQMAEFVDAVAAGRQPLASGREVLATVKLTEAAVHSAATGEVVRL
jgi:predicted dehydrogenase